MKKKIMILVMSCNDSFFVNEENVIKQTWAKPIIDGKYKNIDFLIYRGGNENFIDTANHVMYIKCEDDIANSFKKTCYALAGVPDEYDYVFRTNTSTFVNVNLLNEFIQNIKDDLVLWTSEIYSLIESPAPAPLYLYGRGNGLIIPRVLKNLIISKCTSYLYLKHHDDYMIGNILNSYWMDKCEDYTKHLKSYTHGWYKSVNTNGDNNHKLCKYGNINDSFDFLKQFITIQVKSYVNRNNEIKSFYELNEVFSKNKDNNIEKTIDDIIKYSENPSIFIGSRLGYIDLYIWKGIPSEKLYEIENQN